MEIKYTDNNLFEMAKDYAISNNKLFQVEIDVTSLCNSNCIFCFQGNVHELQKDEFSLDEMKRLIRELHEMGVYHIGFAGGEPFARKDFIEIIEYTKRLGFRVSLVSNGHLITHNDIERMYNCGIDHVTISFHSLNLDNYLKHFGIGNPDLYHIALDNIKYMLSRKINVGIAVTVTKFNANESAKIMQFFNNLGVEKEDIQFNLLLNGKKEINSLIPEEGVILQNDKILSKQVFNDNNHVCSAARISCSISSNGNVYPCTFFNVSAGNLKEQNILQIWNESHLFKMIRSITPLHFKKCLKCAASNVCHICMVDNMNQTNNIFMPAETYCKIRKNRGVE